jgi:elongation factor P--(R)-beta-lysine ligase
VLNKDGLLVRAALFRLIRLFFYQQGFVEVDTPIRQPIYIPESNITPITSEKEYLQTSPELCMKRLLAAGNNKIFQICHCFRKEEKGRLHLEEFQMLEWYRVGSDYHQLMSDCEILLRFLTESLNESQLSNSTPGCPFFSGINLGDRWERLTVADAFLRYSPIELDRALQSGRFDETLVECIEPLLGIASPVFLYDYPVEHGSLAKKKEDNPSVAERFELYINGVELANGFSELTDADEQRLRFTHEIKTIKESTGRDAVMPEKFLEELKLLESAAGIALGIDRLFMIATSSQRIADAVTFSPEDFI